MTQNQQNELEEFLKDRRSDHLFLLVGGNTLPNWVAAQLLLKQPNGRVYLVYTSGVRKQLERLKKILEEEGKPVSCFETDSADEEKIFKAVKDQAERLARTTSGKIGLNYTGGTKMMSVHAHHAIREAKDVHDPILSYLDAHSLELKFDDPPGGERDVASAHQVCISIEKLFKLHGDPRKYKRGDRDRFSYDDRVKAPNAARGLAIAYSHLSGQKLWRKWYNEMMKSKPVDQAPLPNDDDFNHLSDAPPEVIAGCRGMLDSFGVKGGETLQTVVDKNGQDFKDVSELTNWFNGLWLEHYTMSQLADCQAKGVKLNDNGLVTNLQATSEKGRALQADVLALRGYQLYYFSCYTGNDPTTAKLKLFEAIVRAQQLGGEETRAAVVACVDNPVALRRQVEEELEDDSREGQFEVFGRDSLPKLTGELKRWFDGKRR